MEIPDFHKEEDRVKYENDILSPFPSADGGAPPSLPARTWISVRRRIR